MGGMTTERPEVVKSEERESTCRDELMVVARDSGNVIDEVDVGKSMGAGKSEVMKTAGRKLADVKESVVVTKSGETVNSAVRRSAVATRLVAEIVEVVYRDGEPRMDGLSMQ